jgi:hypothetical protein
MYALMSADVDVLSDRDRQPSDRSLGRRVGGPGEREHGAVVVDVGVAVEE